jgi:type II secretory pathway pseudopilin PulG
MSHRNSSVKSRKPAQRRGATMIELTVAIVVLMAAVIVSAQSLTLVAAQRRIAERQAVAREAAANALESAMALSWSETTVERLAAIELPADARDVLPDAQLQVTLVPATDLPTGNAPREMQIRVLMTPDATGRAASRPVQLTAWKFARAEPQP